MLTDFIDRRTANVYGIYGHLGGGKTLTAVEIILFSLSLGWKVSTNIRVFHISRFQENYQFIEDFAEVDFWSLPVGAPRGSSDTFRSCIVIDECAEFFDQYSSNSPQVKKFLSWLRHSSKRGQFVFLIVQQPEFIAKSLRLLINKWICCLDMYQLRLPFLHIRPPFCGDFVARRILDKWGNVISSGFNLVNKKDVGFYYSTSQSIALAGRQGEDDTVPTSKPPLPLQQSLFFFGLLFIYFVLYLSF